MKLFESLLYGDPHQCEDPVKGMIDSAKRKLHKINSLNLYGKACCMIFDKPQKKCVPGLNCVKWSFEN